MCIEEGGWSIYGGWNAKGHKKWRIKNRYGFEGCRLWE